MSRIRATRSVGKLYQEIWYNLDMETIAASKFKATCLSVVDRVHKTHKPVVITRYGKPVAELVPPRIPKRPKKSWLGDMAGTMEIVGDIIKPAFDENEWDALR